MKYFGTDGIRLDDINALIKIAEDITYAFENLEAKNVVVGKDNRPHSQKIAKTLIKNLIKRGINVFYYKTITSPAIAFYTLLHKADFGIVITASHNPASTNGLKFFNSKAEKLDEQTEKLIEGFLEQKQSLQKEEFLKPKGKLKILNCKKYIEFLKNQSINLSGRKIVLDCSNGASGKIAKKFFSSLGAKVKVINAGSGKNINKNCGAVYPEQLAKVVKQSCAEVGFAFDGDADRCVCVLKEGQILSGDNLLLAIGRYFNFKKVVGTILSNGGIEKAFNKSGIEFFRSDVGDQEVYALMKKHNVKFGGERSGHFIFANLLPTGDGLLSALQILKIKNLEKYTKFKKIPYVSENIVSKDKNADLEKLLPIKKQIESDPNFDGRIVLRASGTEPKVRILIEHKNLKQAEKLMQQFLNTLR